VLNSLAKIELDPENTTRVKLNDSVFIFGAFTFKANLNRVRLAGHKNQ
jgi:hypothetical protein